MHPGRRTLCNYGRTPARPGFAKPRDRGKGTGGAKMTTRSAERTLGLCSSNVAFSSCPSLSLLSLSTPSSSPPPPGWLQLPFFFRSWKKEADRRAQPAGRRSARWAGWARGQRPRGVLPDEVRPPRGVDQDPGRRRGRGGGTPASPASSALLAPCPPPP